MDQDYNVVNRMLCIGDSLTEGYYHQGLKSYPFTLKLQILLDENKFDDFDRCQVINFGSSGIRTHDMIGHVKRHFPNPQQRKFPEYIGKRVDDIQYATICLGLNDIDDVMQKDSKYQPKMIQIWAENLKRMIKILRQAKVKEVYLITLPICGLDFTSHPSYNSIKSKMNKKIKDIVKNNEIKGLPDHTRLYLVDLENTPLNYPKFGNEEKLTDDLLHYLPFGYDLLAEIIFKIFCNNHKKLLTRDVTTRSTHLQSEPIHDIIVLDK